MLRSKTQAGKDPGSRYFFFTLALCYSLLYIIIFKYTCFDLHKILVLNENIIIEGDADSCTYSMVPDACSLISRSTKSLDSVESV